MLKLAILAILLLPLAVEAGVPVVAPNLPHPVRNLIAASKERRQARRDKRTAKRTAGTNAGGQNVPPVKKAMPPPPTSGGVSIRTGWVFDCPNCRQE
jgi:hypothetical protein